MSANPGTRDPDSIREYWDEQARAYRTDPRATTQDYWMREIEIRAIGDMLADLPVGARVLDIGCGNGFSTLRLLERFPHLSFVGGDYSTPMIEMARASQAQLSPALRPQISFQVMDVTSLSNCDGTFDAVVSDRCLINLVSLDAQRQALERIAASLLPRGLYVAVENFVDGQNNLNAARSAQGLTPIPIRWHNLFLDPETFTESAGRWFDYITHQHISSTYYLVTRVVYSKLCQLEGRDPDYDHPIYEIATKLPICGNYGPIKLYGFRRRN